MLVKVRERLLSRQKGLEQREKARKLRELKKFGKKVRVYYVSAGLSLWYCVSAHLQVQQDILQKRREETKNLMKKYNKKGVSNNHVVLSIGK